MLKGIDPVLSGALLKALDELGHGDRLALVDRNFPAHSRGVPVITLGEVTVSRAARAILSVFPLDSFEPTPLERMAIDGQPDTIAEVQAELLEVVREFEPEQAHFGAIERHDFYERAAATQLIVQTLDNRPWACFILQKGVVFD